MKFSCPRYVEHRILVLSLVLNPNTRFRQGPQLSALEGPRNRPGQTGKKEKICHIQRNWNVLIFQPAVYSLQYSRSQ